MYVPKYFKKIEQSLIDEFVRHTDFAIIVNSENNTPLATHIPIEIVQNGDDKFIYGHFARGNRQWRTFDADQDVLVILAGPHTYVSPRWYNHINVPTWNYMVVHIYGKPRIIHERSELYAMVKRLVDKYEGNREVSKPYRLEALPEDFIEKEINGIVGFEIKVERMEANFKLSQNRNQEDSETIISELRSSGEVNAAEVADVMARNLPHLFGGIFEKE
ncbi:FMN-binding negative transcriptional regulator [candidate division KSB1 bacterium]|nr:FMN-binding negative transcriptional regulator [candidate division KSB1 bacterium]NIR69258.1 FMN-binding negative transcriptional regulator [candidate division KSB1 bacterium]NIS27431.1 FMN-binding negative transcriptional regulator [candidate division KSB1 bacterium]NIT74257.1 FMN-binding negative transcriptional regulator [candidate division KSB1 bacterium]NIU28149.1 FMN-binding negative transcriptional regulator [candidate division KSB1 bacterium]